MLKAYSRLNISCDSSACKQIRGVAPVARVCDWCCEYTHNAAQAIDFTVTDHITHTYC